MEKTFGQDDPAIARYTEGLFRPEDAVLEEIRGRSDRAGLPAIQVGGMDVRHLEVLTRALGAKKAVEIGTLGGYSGVSICRGLAKGGKLYTFEYEPRHALVARESFKKAGFARRAEIFVGPAAANLKKIEGRGPFDLVFIDADKTGYPAYFKWAARHLRVGGVVLADNTFAWGMIAAREIQRPRRASVLALRRFNAGIAASRRFRATILPTGEGLTMGVKVR